MQTKVFNFIGIDQDRHARLCQKLKTAAHKTQSLYSDIYYLHITAFWVIRDLQSIENKLCLIP